MFTSAEERGGSEEQRQALESVKRELGRASQQQTRQLTRAGGRNKARITQTEGIVILQAFYSISAYSSFVSPIMCSSSELLGNACVWPD